MTHPAILESIQRGGETVDLRRPEDWREIRNASTDEAIDHGREATTYTGEHDGDAWSVCVHADQPREWDE